MASASVILLAAASVSVLDRPDGFAFLQLLSIAAFLAGAVAAGVLIRNRERIFVDTERRAAAAEADRLAAAERAVVSERSRIAREMHDVVAHSMSVVAVQAAAGREIVHADPDKAAEVFARIEAVGRESLVELRRMLGALRETGDDDASLSPQPGISDIAAAVAESSSTGVRTRLVIDGPQRPLAPGIELAAYRIVQESLTNVRKHAGGSASATVRISYEPHVLVVEVTDDGRGAVTSLSGVGTGHGLIGMRERVEIYDGEFTSGPRSGGGYAVRATLPIVNTDLRTRTP
jgi:signal transduction histidine kinase